VSPTRGRSLSEVFRQFAAGAAGASPLNECVAVALSRSDEALRALEAAPARARRPVAVLAALHDLALAGRAPTLSSAYAAGDAEAAAGAAVDLLVSRTDEVVAVAVRRRPVTWELERCAVLYPAVAEAARRAGGSHVGLIDLSCSTGFNLHLDRIGVSYHPPVRTASTKARPDSASRSTVGDPSSPVQLSCSAVGGRDVPTRAVPEVVARIGIDTEPVDLTDPVEARWLRASRPPDASAELGQVEAALGTVATAPPLLLRGDAVELLPDAIAQVPDDALPVVTTTWALSRLPLESRLRFLQALDPGAGRPVAWVSVEGVGVAPGVPTFGDRPASGHSIVGISVFRHASRHAEAVGRCWRRGRILAWLADSPSGRPADSSSY
jgi:hypothetical protein